MNSTAQRDLAADTVYDLLSSAERRSVVAHLRAREEATVDDLIDIAAPDRSADDRRVEIRLVHNHLPRLADAGVVEYDRDRGVVARGDRFADLRAAAASLDLEPDGSPVPLLE